MFSDYTWCKLCSSDNTLVWHSDGLCPKDVHKCIICGREVKKNTPYSIELPGGSNYNGLYLCCSCIDGFIFRNQKLKDSEIP